MKTIEVKMIYFKSTKNKHVYVTDDDQSAVPTIYIDKSDLPTDHPKRIKLVISDE